MSYNEQRRNRMKGNDHGKLKRYVRDMMKPGETKCMFPKCEKNLSILEKMFSDYCFKHEREIQQNLRRL